MAEAAFGKGQARAGGQGQVDGGRIMSAARSAKQSVEQRRKREREEERLRKLIEDLEAAVRLSQDTSTSEHERDNAAKAAEKLKRRIDAYKKSHPDLKRPKAGVGYLTAIETGRALVQQAADVQWT